MREVSIDFLQQQVRTIWAESREVRVFLWEGHVPPHASDLDRCPLYVISFPVPIRLFPLLVIFRHRLLPALSGIMALLLSVGSSTGGSSDSSPCVPPISSFYVSTAATSPPSSAAPSPVPLDMSGQL